MKSGKGMIRSLVRRGTDDGKLRPGEERAGRRSEPVLCERCGAMLHRRKWQRPAVKPTHEFLGQVRWDLCPACTQESREEYLGRIVVERELEGDEDAVRRRIANVAKRAEFTQGQRRVVSIERRPQGGLEILTTSQKLAHRIVHELKKAFGGRAVYRWADDGHLDSKWFPRPVVRP